MVPNTSMPSKHYYNCKLKMLQSSGKLTPIQEQERNKMFILQQNYLYKLIQFGSKSLNLSSASKKNPGLQDKDLLQK